MSRTSEGGGAWHAAHLVGQARFDPGAPTLAGRLSDGDDGCTIIPVSDPVLRMVAPASKPTRAPGVDC